MSTVHTIYFIFLKGHVLFQQISFRGITNNFGLDFFNYYYQLLHVLRSLVSFNDSQFLHIYILP